MSLGFAHREAKPGGTFKFHCEDAESAAGFASGLHRQIPNLRGGAFAAAHVFALRELVHAAVIGADRPFEAEGFQAGIEFFVVGGSAVAEFDASNEIRHMG